jgi:hypothetical protein
MKKLLVGYLLLSVNIGLAQIRADDIIGTIGPIRKKERLRSSKMKESTLGKLFGAAKFEMMLKIPMNL